MLFSEFLLKTGAKKISIETGIPIRTLHSWARLERMPSPYSVWKIIKKSKGKITWEGVYLPFALIRGDKHLSKEEAIEKSKEIINSKNNRERA
jgi:hypothetical protein